MKLSIVIVNYNVAHFLEQCLISVYNALHDIESEIFVVDNNSVDGSMHMLKTKFPGVIAIQNKENVGFSKANNQALLQAKGEYALLLNPDTVVQEDTFSKIIAYMDQHPDTGALGVAMIDGKGNFLPESKRGLPTPLVALFKLSGLTALFPESKTFARYYLGHLPANHTHEVEVLAGAFMLLRKSALEKTGLLDETYFMYGEDIDLSYRMLKAGYKNIYFADTQIIHYKGESTKKGSLNYVFIFYNAMQIFAAKHFSSGQARLYRYLINAAIWMRAGLSMVSRLVQSAAMPALDALFSFGGLYYLKLYWEHNHRFVSGGHYPPEFMQIAVPAYISVWLVSIFLSGGYEKPTRIWNLLRGIFVGTLIILAVYGLLSEDYRFSRALILLGALWTALILPAWRSIVQFFTKRKLLAEANPPKRRLIVGGYAEYQRIESLLRQTAGSSGFTGWVDISDENAHQAIGNQFQLSELIDIYRINEVIFCAKDLSASEIMQHMNVIQPKQPEIKIAPPESYFIIGSNSINTQGEWYAVQVNTIAKPGNRRMKRFLDIFLSVLFLLVSPLLIFVQQRPSGLFRNIIEVLTGKKTWVSYHPNGKQENLPILRKGILTPDQQIGLSIKEEKTLSSINFLYAKEYSPQTDIQIILKNIRKLGGYER